MRDLTNLYHICYYLDRFLKGGRGAANYQRCPEGRRIGSAGNL
jgi:hypothetical protein